MQPLPGGALPAAQTIEGGAQIRVTQQGFQTLTSILPALVNQQFQGGFCASRGTIGGSSLGAEYCHQNQGTCTPGCNIGVQLNPGGLSMQVVGNSLRVNVSATLSTQLPIHGWVRDPIFGFTIFDDSCTIAVSSPNLGGSIDIAFGIRPSDGELTLSIPPNGIHNLNLNLNINGCGIIGDIADIAVDLLDDIINSFVGEFALELLRPAINDIIQDTLPDPLGMEGLMDVGAMLEGISPGTSALMEARVVPGGYVSLATGNGLSLGVITGMNADEDITTRTGIRPDNIPLASEPHLCVPPMIPPAFGSPPHNLPISSRSTFSLNPAGEFNGNPEPSADIAMGLSETFLDLAGHHLVTSGGMCLGVGTSYINQLNVGTIGILVPSLAELTSDTGKDPLLLVTRPQKAVDFTIGDNTAASPALTLNLHNLEIDFYAFLYERYVRAFTLELTMNVGLNLEFETPPGMPTVIKPMLTGISAQTVTVKVLNSQFVRETPQELEMVLPSVFDLVTPLLGNIPPIQVPTFAGFSLNNLSIQHVTTSQDDFLALYATLGASTLMRQLAEQEPFAKAAVLAMDEHLGPAPDHVTAKAKLRSVVTPAPDEIREAMMKGGKMPEVTFDVDRLDDQGRELEYSYNLDNGMWRPYAAPVFGGFIVRDPAFAWQGKYNIGLKSRVKGDYRTTSHETVTPIIIDSVGPKVNEAKLVWDDGILGVPMFDNVSEYKLTYAFGKLGDDEPRTEWFSGARAELSEHEVNDLLVDNAILLFAKDEAGNLTIASIAPFHGQAGSSGCSCDTSGAPSPGSLALLFVVGAVLFGRRRGRKALVVLRRTARHSRAIANAVAFAGLSVLTSLVPGCDCGDPGAKSCEVASDCGPDYCPEGELPFCIDNTCICSEDIIAGRVGPYSDVATGADGSIWVSAYAQHHGDLVVAKADPGVIPTERWEWVDGIPDGPILIPDSKIRGGIDAAGPDVGMYTSIAVNNAGEPMVTYFDRDTSSLKFAHKSSSDGTWKIHTIQQGTGVALGELGELIGMYSSISLRTDDGRPGVAYLAHVMDQNGGRAEVRFAASQTPSPSSPGDWQMWIVDSTPLMPADPNEPEIYPLPSSLGLFIDSARMPNQAPVVAYYDRANGDLKLAKFNPQSGQFATPVILDGSNGYDAGWTPSVGVDTTGKVHVTYVGSTDDDLKYITDAPGAVAEVIDDGYRIVGTTVDGLPKPEFHFVGDDAALVLANGMFPMVAYQDATTQELLLASKQQDGRWTRISIAGATDPWPGAYGFFASSGLLGTEMVISTWVIDQPVGNPFHDNWVEVFTRPTQIQ